MRIAGVIVALTITALGAFGGCDCGKKPAKPAAGSAAPTRDMPTTSKRPTTKKPGLPRDFPKEDVRSPAPITVEEARSAVPTLEGARSLGATAVSPNGTQARSSYCVDADSLEDANAVVVAQLGAAGWTSLTTRPPNAEDPLSGFATAGERGALRVSATVTPSRRTGCDATVNQFFVTIGVNKVGGAED